MSFKIKQYGINSEKIKNGKVIRFVFLSDLHLIEHGDNNIQLISIIHDLNPDFILIGGDMIVGKELCSAEIAENLLINLSKHYPVYCAMGNHEQRLKSKVELFGDTYELYRRHLESAGICVLDNKESKISIKGKNIILHGLNLPLCHYKRFARHQLSMNEMESYVGKCPSDGDYHILLAHHPRYADTYFSWGADLILSGHIHGGLIRLGKKAVISPDIQLFPKYGYGKIKRGKQKMIISGGLGEHTIPLRMFNPRELLLIEIK